MSNWTVSAWPILASAALKSTLVLGAAWMIAQLLRRRSAASRHMVWTASAAALLALPLLSLVLPAVRVRMANAVLPADTALVFRTTSAAGIAGGGGPAVQLAQAGGGPAAAAVRDRAWNGRDAAVLLWTGGIAVGILQMLLASAMLWRTRRKARVSPDQQAADALAPRFGIAQPVEVLESAAGMPMTFGVLRPTVLLPETARTWSEKRREVVLLHELAHIARGDAATQLLARAALALHWWNPLAWMAWREFLKEREHATDDLVLGAGTAASEYAGHLLEIARTMQLHGPGAQLACTGAGVAMARRSELEGRLLSILDGRVQRGRQGRTAAVVAAVLAVAVIAPLAAIRAQSQAEQGAPPAVESTILTATQQKNHEILDRAAVSYEQLRQYAEAQKLREASLAIVEQTSGPGSADYAVALMKLGDVARNRGAADVARDYYTKAVALGDRPEVFGALFNLGRLALMHTMILPAQPATGAGEVKAALSSAAESVFRLAGGVTDPAKALEYFKRARNVANNGNDLSTALLWMAITRQSQPDGEAEAESLYGSALATADPSSAEKAMALEFYAEFLKAHERTDEAGTLITRARAIRRERIKGMGPQEVAVSSVMKTGPGVTAPRLVFKREPEYSEEARAAKYQGTVMLQIVVDVDGQAKNIDVLRGLGLGLDEQAVAAVRQWRFKPGEKDGMAVPIQATVEINFKLL